MASKNDSIIPYFNSKTNEDLSIDLNKTVNGTQQVIIARLAGFVDTYNTDFFRDRIKAIMAAGFQNLILDCQGLTYISSTGIGAMTGILKDINSYGGKLVLVRVNSKIAEIFRLLGFISFFNIQPTEEVALTSFAGGSASTSEPSTPAAPAPAPVTFPFVVTCPSCGKKLKVPKPGKFRCSGCKIIFSVDENGATAKQK